MPALDARIVAEENTSTARQPKMLITDGSSTHGKSIIATLVAPLEGEPGRPQRSRLLDLHTPEAKRHVASYLATVLEEVCWSVCSTTACTHNSQGFKLHSHHDLGLYVTVLQDIEKAGGPEAVHAVLGDNASTVKCACNIVKKKHRFKYVLTTAMCTSTHGAESACYLPSPSQTRSCVCAPPPDASYATTVAPTCATT